MKNINIWKDDLLNRKQEGTFLIDYLLARYEKNKDKPFVLNINAEWGYGKTFFLESIAKELRGKNYNVIEFDAWKNDYTKEPLLAFMSEINNSLEMFFNKKQTKSVGFLKALKNNSIPILISILSKRLTGLTIDELMEVNEEDKEEQPNHENEKATIENEVSSLTTKLAQYALQEHNTIKDSIEKFKSSMRKLLSYIDSLGSMKLPLFILIDELDRCRPSYSIELLENIKHLFDIEGIVFVVATDSKQLSHSINAIYGENFASEQYLKRFFDQEYNLTVPNNIDYVTSLFQEYSLLDDDILFSPLEDDLYKDKNKQIELFNLFVNFFKLNPRDIKQVIVMLSTIRLTWSFNDKKIHLVYLLFLIMLKQKSNELFIQYQDKLNIKLLFEALDFKEDIAINTHSITNHHNYKRTDLKMTNLIEIYHNFLNITLESLSTKRHNTNRTIDDSILNIFYMEFKALDNSSNSFSLKKYFDLVLHAGQFK